MAALSMLLAVGACMSNAAAAAPLPAEVADLPLVEIPAARDGPWLAVLLTGDGGWASLVTAVSGALAQQGIGVVGFNSLQYFWTAKAPEQAAADLARVIQLYTELWHRPRTVVIGYSIGAEVLPFMVNRLSEPARSAIDLVVLIGPGQAAQFEFHVTDWLRRQSSGTPVLPEVEKLRGTPLLCVRGSEESASLCAKLPEALGKRVELTGGHHYNGAYGDVADSILEAVRGLR